MLQKFQVRNYEDRLTYPTLPLVETLGYGVRGLRTTDHQQLGYFCLTLLQHTHFAFYRPIKVYVTQYW